MWAVARLILTTRLWRMRGVHLYGSVFQIKPPVYQRDKQQTVEALMSTWGMTTVTPHRRQSMVVLVQRSLIEMSRNLV